MSDEPDIDDPARQYRLNLPPAPVRRSANFHKTWTEARDYLASLGWTHALSADVGHFVKDNRGARIKSRANGEFFIHYSMRKRR